MTKTDRKLAHDEAAEVLLARKVVGVGSQSTRNETLEFTITTDDGEVVISAVDFGAIKIVVTESKDDDGED